VQSPGCGTRYLWGWRETLAHNTESSTPRDHVGVGIGVVVFVVVVVIVVLGVIIVDIVVSAVSFVVGFVENELGSLGLEVDVNTATDGTIGGSFTLTKSSTSISLSSSPQPDPSSSSSPPGLVSVGGH